MPTKQSSTPKEGRRITSTGNSARPMARNQYRHYWTLTQIEWNRYYSGHYGLIHKDDLTKGYNDKYIIGRNHKNLQGQYMEVTWSA